MLFTTNTASNQTDKDKGQSVTVVADMSLSPTPPASLAELFIALMRRHPFKTNSTAVVHRADGTEFVSSGFGYVTPMEGVTSLTWEVINTELIQW